MPASGADFNLWEDIAIEYDIAIDEERDDEVLEYRDEDRKALEKVLKAKRKDFLKEIDKILGKLDAELINDNIRKKVRIRPSKNPQNRFWTFLFLTKKIRAILLSQHTDKATEKLDWLVDFLIWKIGNYVSEPFKYLLIMFELTAITVGEQSLGFSEKAREILNSNYFPEEKKHPYKALIHYNQGIAKAHMHQLHDALEEYNEAIKEFKNSQIINNRNWCNYVYYPTLLQKADALTKMQFSYNSLKIFEEMEDSNNSQEPSAFKKARKEIMKAFCYIDILDLNEFDKHLKTINELEDQDKRFYLKEKSCINLRNMEQIEDRDNDFLDAQTPQNSFRDKRLPSLLASHYNSLILERAQEALKKKTNEILKNNKKSMPSLKKIINYGIFEFLEKYMKQCKDNRFDRLSLKETVLEYIEILESLIREDIGDSFNSEGPIIKTLNRLIKLLNGPCGKMEFSKEEIDPNKKPPIHQHVIDKACKVFEDINDKILKEWFAKIDKDKQKIEKLPEYLQISFNFEKDLIKELKSKRELRKEYVKKTLDIRERLLKKISECSYKSSNLSDLRDHLVCICESTKSDKKNNCLGHMINGIKDATKIPEENYPNKGETLQINDYDVILGQEAKRFHRHITGRSVQPVFFNKKKNNVDSLSINYIGLRRWNSFTPELSFSVGGGYFVFLSNNKGNVLAGIAVDPGFDFIRNFFRQGFTLADIDLVLLTHGHPDHIRDFPAIVELLHEERRLPENERMNHKIYSVMSLGCYRRLEEYIAKPPYRLLFYDTFVLDIDKQNQSNLEFECLGEKERYLRLLVPTKNKEADNGKVKLEINYFSAFHQDYSESDSYGYKLIFSQNSNNKISIGFTGDSKWFSGYAGNFNDCDLICSHIGSIVETNEEGKHLKDYKIVGQAERLIRTRNHPYLFGEILFLQDWKEFIKKKSLILISEFGEEMKGMIRPDLIKRFNRVNLGTGCWSYFAGSEEGSNKRAESEVSENCQDKANNHNLLTIPVDVGLRIGVPLNITSTKNFTQKVYCCVCEQFVEPQKIDYEVYGYEEAIFYVCKTCKRSKSTDVRHSIYQKYYESGHELKKDEAYT